MESSIPRIDVDVAVLGCGTTGLTLASLLSKDGIRVAAVDRCRLQVQHPRATHIEAEMMRAFQTLGLAHLEPSFSSVGRYRFYDQKWNVCMEVNFDRGYIEQGWRSNYMFHQPDWEAMVRGELNDSPSAEIFFGWEVLELTEVGDRVHVLMREEISNQERIVNAAFVVGADGANSMVRRAMGCELTDYEATHRALIVDIKPLVDQPADLPERDTFIQGGIRNPLIYVPIAPPRLRFELMLRPDDDAVEFGRAERAYQLLSPWFKADEYRLLRSDVYEWRSIVASPWRKGRVMIAGDAAHTMPPTLGQGMCSGVRDALNLAWKLPRVVRGESPIELLETYESERRPHTETMVTISARLANSVEEMPPEAPPQGIDPPATDSDVVRPQIGPGVRDEGDEPIGVLSAQPKLSDGSLLDDTLGFRFGVVGDPETVAAASTATRSAWEKLDVAVLDEAHDEVIEWVRSLGASAVVIRPDRYVYGVADDGAGLDRLTELLGSQLAGAGMAVRQT